MKKKKFLKGVCLTLALPIVMALAIPFYLLYLTVGFMCTLIKSPKELRARDLLVFLIIPVSPFIVFHRYFVVLHELENYSLKTLFWLLVFNGD